MQTAVDFLTDPVIIILILASFTSWWIIVDRAIVLLHSAKSDRDTYRGKRAWGSPLSRLKDEFDRLVVKLSREDLLLGLDAAVDMERIRLEKAIAVLGAIGSTSPYVGLLGTVIGIIRSFHNIQMTNNMSPATVGGGISIALIATAAGLAVAIPAVIGHHLLSSAITKRVSVWEAVLAKWVAEGNSGGETDESIETA
ncbi:MAG: MotA/TolQ/ExbB proton channel family protein [bacterium]